MEFTTADWIALIAAAIGALAGIGGIITAIFARKQAEEAAQAALKAQSEATRIAGEAARLQALDWTDQFFVGVRVWGEEVVDSISICIHLPEIEADEERKRLWNQARTSLSALCDRGRWFFPNKFEDKFGTEKEPAYRGFRRRILDHVLAAYNAMKTCPTHGDCSAHKTLIASQRGFVSEVQRVLNPQHREAQIREIQKRFDIADQMRDAADDEKENGKSA